MAALCWVALARHPTSTSIHMRSPKLPVALALLTAACAAPPANDADPAAAARAAREAIDAANARGVEAMNARDAGAYMTIVGEGATVMSPDGSTTVGRVAFDSAMRANWAADTVRRTFSWRADSVEVHGDFAYEVGRGQSVAGADTIRTQYITFWRRDADGAWRMHRDFTVPLRPAR